METCSNDVALTFVPQISASHRTGCLSASQLKEPLRRWERAWSLVTDANPMDTTAELPVIVVKLKAQNEVHSVLAVKVETGLSDRSNRVASSSAGLGWGGRADGTR